MFQGKSIRTQWLDERFVELCFDREGSVINKFDAATLQELQAATESIAAAADVRGVLITSAKDGFIAGADITGFPALFASSTGAIQAVFADANKVMNAVEDLPVPTVVAINGFALGGGLELALSADCRVVSTTAQLGFPEVKLGLVPGFGGTVRLPRVASVATTLEWISSGAPRNAEAAKAAGVADEVVAPEALREAALALLRKAAAGEFDWRARRAMKLEAVKQASAEISAVATKTGEAVRKAGVNKHQPAALAAVELIARSALLHRQAALELETETFTRLAQGQAAASLVQIFLSEQLLKKRAKERAKNARSLGKAAVLGAGIMGGGIAYTGANKGTPVLLKDIQQQQLDIGLAEARKYLGKQVASGKLTQQRADGVLASIQPQLDYSNFDTVDVVVEAVVEKLEVKRSVLAEVEAVTRSDAIIATNTSSLRIDDLCVTLQRPENFVGMHFFNPAPLMPLVEVIRGGKTSEAAVATIVKFASSMGKTPIVVKDGPGFLVNRILTPYMLSFMQLVRDGVDFVAIDKAMEQFGWPMGPAYLNDVIGMDTANHVFRIISAGFPDRLRRDASDAVQVMLEQKRLGQKNGVGFYRYEPDPAGKPKKSIDPATYELLKPLQRGAQQLALEQIVERMMLPVIVEAAWCLDEEVVASPHELDMALLLGLGLPQYLGGALKYADWLGLDNVVAMSDRHATLGKHFVVPASLREKAAKGERYYQ